MVVARSTAVHLYSRQLRSLLLLVTLTGRSHGDDLLGEPQRMDQALLGWCCGRREPVSRSEVDVLIVDQDAYLWRRQAALPRKNPASPGGRRGATGAV